MRLAQISDTHFGTERPEVVAGALYALRELAPDVVVLSGDVTQRGRRGEFAAARQFMDALPQRTARVVIPGNHELPLFNLWARFVSPYANYERAFGPRESLWHQDGIAVLGLDATHPRRHKDGALDPDHLAGRLAEARAACGPRGLLVVAAHQPLWTAWQQDRHNVMRDATRIARQLADARADVVMSGHVHVPMLETSAGCDPELSWRFVLSGAGTTVSRRTRAGAPNSFNVLELAASELRACRYDWDGGGFLVKEALKFRRDAGGWSKG